MRYKLHSFLFILAWLLVVMVNAMVTAYAFDDSVALNEENFPDEIFREHVITYDTDENRSLSQDEISAVKEMDLYNKEISDLEGIAVFFNLKELYCMNNNLSELPALPPHLEVLSCYGKDLLALPVLPDTLKRLECVDTAITALPVLPESLEVLNFSHNYELETSPVLPSGLKELTCNDSNLTSLPSLPEGIKSVSCIDNDMIELPALPASLEKLYCDGNQLVTLPELPSNMEKLYCCNNNLESLPPLPDGLLELDCSHNELTNLPALPASLKKLSCASNSLKGIFDISTVTDLTFLDCGKNQLTGIILCKEAEYNNIQVYDNPMGYEILDAPVIEVKPHSTSGKPVVTWNKVVGANWYEIWISQGGEYSLLTTIRERSFTHTDALEGHLYYYKVKAKNGVFSKTVSPFGKRVYTRCKAAKPVIKVVNHGETGKPTISWGKVQGATGYEVWRKAGSNGSYKRIKSVTGCSTRDSAALPGVIYSYKVKALCGKNGIANSTFSAEKRIACDLAKPKGIKVTTVASTGKPKVTWNKVNGATKYEVWRKIGANGTYKKIYTTVGNSYTNTAAKAGTIYYYKVKAICGKNSGGNSVFSASDYVTCDLAAPKITVSGTKKRGKIVVSWSKVENADRYYVYRATSKNGTYEKYATTISKTYTDSSVKKGKYYYYKVKAVYDGKPAATSAYSNRDYAYVR